MQAPDAGPSIDASPQPDAAPTTLDQTRDRAFHSDGSGNFDDYTAERELCESRGWTKDTIETGVGDLTVNRKFLYNAPAGPWAGVVIIMHGGGGNYTNFCTSGQTGSGLFALGALNRDFAVFLLDSTDVITDRDEVLCGKVWDDKVLARENYDLPYLQAVITSVIPDLRPASSSSSIFVSGFSSGGYMTTRVAGALNHLITAFAPIGSGSPYGWYRDCSQPSPRPLVAGVGLDSDTDIGISVVDSCGSTIYDPDATYPNEAVWSDGGAATRPPFLKAHHFYDGIADFSCHNRVINRLAANGYTGNELVVMPEGESRNIQHHRFHPGFIAPILDFFQAQ